MNDKKYYPILLEYVGPNGHGVLNNRIRVLKEPGHKNLSRKPCAEGWLGTTDDWSKTALGECTEAETRAILVEHGIQIQDEMPVAYADYSFDHERSEGWNEAFAYRPDLA